MARLKSESNSKFVLLLFGPAMSGKTVLASQFPNPFFIDLDGQLGSVRSLASHYNKDFDFPTIPIDEAVTEDEDFISYCGQTFAKQNAWKKTKKIVEVLSQKLSQDDTLILDNLSRASEYLMTEIKTRTGHNTLQIADWGMFVDELRTLIEYLHSRYTKCNTILIAHEENRKDDFTGRLMKKILLPTSMSERLPSKVSDFLYMNVKASGSSKQREAVRSIQSMPDPTNAVGSRSLIPDIENPTFEDLRPYLESYLGRKLGDPTWTPK